MEEMRGEERRGEERRGEDRRRGMVVREKIEKGMRGTDKKPR